MVRPSPFCILSVDLLGGDCGPGLPAGGSSQPLGLCRLVALGPSVGKSQEDGTVEVLPGKRSQGEDLFGREAGLVVAADSGSGHIAPNFAEPGICRFIHSAWFLPAPRSWPGR